MGSTVNLPFLGAIALIAHFKKERGDQPPGHCAGNSYVEGNLAPAGGDTGDPWDDMG